MAGRRPKPTAVKVLEGNPGRRPLNASEPRAEPHSGRAPAGLGLEGKKFWKKYARALAAMNVLTEVDEPALRMATEHYEVAMRAAAELRTPEPVVYFRGQQVLGPDGAVVIGPKGKQVLSRVGVKVIGRDGQTVIGTDGQPMRAEPGDPVLGPDGQPMMRWPGLTVEGRDGPKKNPLVQVLRDHSMALRGYLTEFGMTPAARSKVKTTNEEQHSLADVLFEQARRASEAAAAANPLDEFERD